MDYLKIYNSLIERASIRDVDQYYESHHIIPKCMNGSDEPDNLVLLTPEEHYLAHQLLVKIYPNNTNLAYAANMMCVNRTNNKLYGWIRRRISQNMKSNNPMKLYPEKNPFSKTGKDHPAYGKIVSEETRKKLADAKRGNKNPISGIKPWNHPRAKSSLDKWKKADIYYKWWKDSGLDHGQNAMARHFEEEYTITHSNLIKWFRKGWIPTEDQEWILFCKI